MIQQDRVWLYDLEVFPNFFSGTFLNRTTEEEYVFYIHNSLNKEEYHQLKEFKEFLRERVGGLIGFNNINYDYPVLHFVIKNIDFFRWLTADEITDKIYQESQRIINEEFTAIRESEVYIAELDLFKIHHFDNKAKRTSLKDLEIHMNYPVVQDLPYKFNEPVKDDQIESIIKYNLNDVKATQMFYEKSKPEIELRKEIGKEYNINLLNANDPKIGSLLFEKFICEDKKITPQELRKMRTFRKVISLKECILPYVSFKSKEFNHLLNIFKSKNITQTKGSIEESVIYKKFKYDYGTGGIHGSIASGIYEADKRYMILDIDVESFYPNLAIRNGFFPQHLGKGFCKIYEDVFNKRSKAKKEGNKAVNAGLKLALNGVYGKSNDVYSFFYDPKFTMQITINGQLLLTMLAEEIADTNATILQINTDGVTIKFLRDKLPEIEAICKKWEQLTNLTLEYKEYSKMVIRDVNNYLAIPVKGEVKYKGCFEIEKAYNKNPSFKIVQIALSEYFVNNVPIETTIKKHKNIYDFCGRHKSTKGWHSELRSIGRDVDANPYLQVDKLQKTNRYYISTDGGAYMKCHEDGREQWIDRDRKTTIFNTYIEKDMKDYNLDYSFYELECRKIIRIVESEQLNLFAA